MSQWRGSQRDNRLNGGLLRRPVELPQEAGYHTLELVDLATGVVTARTGAVIGKEPLLREHPAQLSGHSIRRIDERSVRPAFPLDPFAQKGKVRAPEHDDVDTAI